MGDAQEKTRTWNLVSIIRQRVKGRPDSEFEQATIRIVIATVITLYFVVSAVLGYVSLSSPSLAIPLAILYVVCGALWAAIIVYPQVSPTRRIAGMVSDVSITLYCMYELGAVGVPLFVILLWVTFGNGFRFGTRYLYLSMALSVVGFGIVGLQSPYWQSHASLFWGIMISLIILPAYPSHRPAE